MPLFHIMLTVSWRDHAFHQQGGPEPLTGMTCLTGTIGPYDKEGHHAWSTVIAVFSESERRYMSSSVRLSSVVCL